MRFKKRMIALVIVLSVFFVSLIWLLTAPQFGGKPKGNNKIKVEASENYKNGQFRNLVNTPIQLENVSWWKVLKEFVKKDTSRVPQRVLPTTPFEIKKSDIDSNKIAFTWFGHSSILIQTEGFNILIDPIFNSRPSPLSFLGSKSFEYSSDYSLDDLPDINAVVISHDHYDHLDYATIKALKENVGLFLVPLACKAHLLRWGIDEAKIIEKDWWETHEVGDSIKFHCTPSRHFSGRRGFDQNATLWCSWAIEIGSKKIYFSGDSGYEKHFNEIGKRFGPFDIAFMECGQYNEAWPYIHMMPEETFKASLDLNTAYVVPIHWGKFKLSLHAWTDPVDRLIEVADENLMSKVITPKVGQSFILYKEMSTSHWWK